MKFIQNIISSKKFLVVLLTISISVNIFSQEKTEEFQISSNYGINHFHENKYLISNVDINYIRVFSEINGSQFSISPSFTFKLFQYVELKQTFDFWYNKLDGKYDYFELRPFQTLSFSTLDIWRVSFEPIYKLEERFFFKDGENNFEFRSRFKMNMLIPINNKAIHDKTFFVNFSGEIYLPHKKTPDFNTNRYRLGASIGYKFNFKWKIKFDYYIDNGWEVNTASYTLDDHVFQIDLQSYF